MIPPSPLPNESDRVADLLRHNVLDTEAEQEFDELVQLAALVCGAEISLVSLVDDHRQWFKAKVGLNAEETAKDIAFCPHALHGRDIFEVPDAALDERFYDNPLVTGEPKIRFYAGQPLRSSLGNPLGTLCVIDRRPRQLSTSQRFALQTLAKQVERLLDLRIKVYDLSQSLRVIEQQRESLDRLNKIKDQTLGVITHDLRSPLASLENTIQLFEQGLLDGRKTAELIPELRPYLQQTYDKVNKVLEWAKDQAERPVISPSPFVVNPVLLASGEWVETMAEGKGVKLNYRLEPSLQALGDRDWVEIVVRNLLTNAIKYSFQGGTVEVFARLEGDRVRIGVQDQGVGMTAYTLESLLERYRGTSTLGTAREQGTGLGLVLCQAYLANLNTRLEIESEVKQGSTVSFLLPHVLPPA
ncbi:MAG: GAF domain-containing sensor histidine kinase [Prochlorothrix sp.]|nr:GAF domain-containing sensor histidine kinase [Prochlorothrix sp.]